MGLQDKISAAKAALLRQYEQISGEHINEEECIIDENILDFIVEFELAIN